MGLRGSEDGLHETSDVASSEYVCKTWRLGARSKRCWEKHAGGIEIAIDEFECSDDRGLRGVGFGSAVRKVGTFVHRLVRLPLGRYVTPVKAHMGQGAEGDDKGRHYNIAGRP